MKIVFETPEDGEDDRLIVRCRNLTPELYSLLKRFKSGNSVLAGSLRGKIYRVDSADVLYVKSYDGKTLIATEEETYGSKIRLHELEKTLVEAGFVRISKSIIVNPEKVTSYSSARSGTLDAYLINSEKLTVSRKYSAAFRQSLGISNAAATD